MAVKINGQPAAAVRVSVLDPIVTQELGNSEAHVMSQAAVTREFENVDARFGDYIRGTKGNNLFDKSKITKGYYINPGNGKLMESAPYNVTDFIPVTPGETYTVSHVYNSTYFKADKSYKSGGDQSSATFTIPDGVYFFRCTVYNPNIDTFQMNKGDTLLPYDDGKTYLAIDNFSEDLLRDMKGAMAGLADDTEEEKVDCFTSLRNHLLNPFVKTQIKLLGDSITQGMGGTGFSATGEQIPGSAGKMNVLTATCWANMLYHYVNDYFNKDVEVSVMDKRIKYNTPKGHDFSFSNVQKNIEGVTGYVNYFMQAVNNGLVAMPNAVEFSFYGDHFSVLYRAGQYNGIFEIYVDGQKVKEVDGYANPGVTRSRVDINGLSFGEHTVQIAIVSKKNESALAYQLGLQGLIIPKTAIVKPWGVSGSISNYPQSVPTLYEDTDDFVIMQFGTNDRHVFFTPDATCENLVYSTNSIKEATGAEVILMASCPAAYKFEYGDDAVRYYHMWDVRNAVAMAAEQLGEPYIDNYGAFMRYASEHGLAIEELLHDGLHPNDLGYKVMFENIMNALGLPLIPDHTRS